MDGFNWEAVAAFTAWTAFAYAMGRRAGRRAAARDLSAPPSRLVSLAELPLDVRKAIETELETGDRIGAIRRLRAETGIGLRDAKLSVEAIVRLRA